jgi:hypothetical protein
MINQILAGILAGSGWLIGYFLYKYTKEELQFAKKINSSFRSTLILPVIFASILGRNPLEWILITVFAITLLVSSLYGIRQKPKHHLLFFAIHSIVFLIAFYLAQVLPR